MMENNRMMDFGRLQENPSSISNKQPVPLFQFVATLSLVGAPAFQGVTVNSHL
jgi:hypothetical protein